MTCIGGDVDLDQRRLGGVAGQAAERAAAGKSTSAVLSPALTLDGNVGGGAKVLLELVAVLAVVAIGASVCQAALAPGLSGVLVFCRAELTGSLSLLLERLLLLGVGVANLNLKLFAVGVLDGVVVEVLDNLLTRITCLEASRPSAD